MKKFVIFLFILSLSTHVKSEVTYLEILKDPTDLRLNLQYAKEQEALGEFKNVIATLERLTALYPSNIDLKLYLLSIAVKTDSTEKVLRLIEEIRQSDEITEDVKTRVAQVFDDINKKRIDDEKAIARQKARQVVEEEEKKRSQLASKESSWTFYQDIEGLFRGQLFDPLLRNHGFTTPPIFPTWGISPSRNPACWDP